MERADMEFIENRFRPLESEMRQGFAEVNRKFAEVNQKFDGVNSRLDQMNGRLDRVGGLVNGGARAMAKIAEWSERTDITTADLLNRVTDIEQRLRKIEGKKD
jgi:hypothetical protein